MSSDPAALPAAEGRGIYRALVLRKQLILAGLALALLLSICIDLALGPASYSLDQVVLALVSPGSVPLQARVVLWEIRLPIALMAVVVGAALSTAGAQMQTILNNPLASPFTLGISAAASFGASVALVFGVGFLPWAIDYVVSVNALLALVQYLASEQALSAVVFWTMGSLTRATWPKLAITTAVVAVSLPLFMRRAWALTALRLGDDKAASFGVNVRWVRLETMMVISLLAAVPVAFVGTIGFIGLVGPHIARMLIGEDQRFFLPASALAGAALLSASSVVSKSLVPGPIVPISIVTALVGVPFFFSLILSTN